MRTALVSLAACLLALAAAQAASAQTIEHTALATKAPQRKVAVRFFDLHALVVEAESGNEGFQFRVVLPLLSVRF